MQAHGCLVGPLFCTAEALPWSFQSTLHLRVPLAVLGLAFCLQIRNQE